MHRILWALRDFLFFWRSSYLWSFFLVNFVGIFKVCFTYAAIGDRVLICVVELLKGLCFLLSSLSTSLTELCLKWLLSHHQVLFHQLETAYSVSETTCIALSGCFCCQVGKFLICRLSINPVNAPHNAKIKKYLLLRCLYTTVAAGASSLHCATFSQQVLCLKKQISCVCMHMLLWLRFIYWGWSGGL